MRLNHRLFFIFISLISLLNLGLSVIHAQVTLDGTLGSTGALSGPDYRIDADLGKQTGSNLFHSFGQFNINTGESATFTGPGTVSNIISRVTGGSGSWIDGLLRSEIPGANLYLLNPRGVMFGPNASLDIGGAFHVSTADYLRLGDNGRFDAALPENSVLTTATPSAFGFLSHELSGIGVEGTLKVSEGQTVSLTGGNIEISGGQLAAQSGHIHIASVASPGELVPSDAGFDISAFERHGEISLSGGAVLNVSGNRGGDIHIRGGRFLISDAGSAAVSMTGYEDGGGIDIETSGDVAVLNGAEIFTETLADGGAGDIRLAADNLGIVGGVVYSQNSNGTGAGDTGNISLSANSLFITDLGAIFIDTGGTGNGGNMRLDTAYTELSEGGRLIAGTSGAGNGGDISLIAGDSLSISGFGVIPGSEDLYRNSGLYSRSTASGQGGSISVLTDTLSVKDEGLITTEILADENSGNGGDITVEAKRVEIERGYISSSGVITEDSQETGNAGNISITARDSVSISGSGLNENGLHGLYYGVFSQTQGTGNGGAVSIRADELNLSKDAMINAQTFGNGPGGTVSLEANRMEIHEGGDIAADSYGAGNAGDVSIIASESVNISGLGVKGLTKQDNSSAIYTAAHSSGNGGNLTVSTPLMTVGKDGSIYADTLGDLTLDGNTLPPGNAGNIRLNAKHLDVSNGGIISAGSESSGIGGNIEIQSDHLEMLNQGAIAAKSTDTGDAGDISIHAEDIRIKNSTVTTGTENAGGGRMTIDVSQLLFLSDGEITTSVRNGEGNGGDISIKLPEFAVLNKSSIIAQAYQGAGGNINIVAEHFIRSYGSEVDASSKLGVYGRVFITSPNENISSGLTLLPGNYLDAARWLGIPCAERSGEKMSRFVITGRDSVPTGFDDLLPSPPVLLYDRP
jgi:filamentous hemagglutinin family protein